MGALAPAQPKRTSDAVNRVLEAAPDAMVVIGANGRIVRVNTQAEKLFGYSQEELLGEKPDLLSLSASGGGMRNTGQIMVHIPAFVC